MTLRLLVTLVLILANAADAAELERYPLARVTGWAVHICPDDPEAMESKALRQVGCLRISGFVDERGDCEKMKGRTVATMKGPVRLRCDFEDSLYVVRP